MQSLRKLGFQNVDTKKHGPVEIWAGRLYSSAATCWILFFIKITFSFWPLLSHHKSVFYPMPFQGFARSRELQTQQSVINFTCECTVLIKLWFWFKVISEWGNYSPEESYWLPSSYRQVVSTLSVKLLRDLPISYLRKKGILGKLKSINTEGPWRTRHEPTWQCPFVSWKDEQYNPQLAIIQYLYQEISTSMVETTGKFSFVEGKLLKLS